MDSHTSRIELLVDLLSVAEHPFIRDLPPLISSLFKAVIKYSLKFRLKFRLLDEGTRLAGSEAASLLILDLLLIRYPVTELLARYLKLFGGVSD